MPYSYSPDDIDKAVDFHFRFENGKYFYFSHDFDGGLPITEDEAFRGQKILKSRKKIARWVSQIATIPISLFTFWQFFFQHSSIMVFLWWIPALIVGIVFYIIAEKSALRPFQLQFYKHLGWKRRGLKRALFDLRVFHGKFLIILGMVVFLFFRGITEYFGLIEWTIGSWKSDFEGVAYTLAGMLVISLIILSTAMTYTPPDIQE